MSIAVERAQPLGTSGWASARGMQIIPTTLRQFFFWTVLRFEAPEEAVEALTAVLSLGLAEKGDWYADFSVGDEHAVVFEGRCSATSR